MLLGKLFSSLGLVHNGYTFQIVKHSWNTQQPTHLTVYLEKFGKHSLKSLLWFKSYNQHRADYVLFFLIVTALVKAEKTGILTEKVWKCRGQLNRGFFFTHTTIPCGCSVAFLCGISGTLAPFILEFYYLLGSWSSLLLISRQEKRENCGQSKRFLWKLNSSFLRISHWPEISHMAPSWYKGSGGDAS